MGVKGKSTFTKTPPPSVANHQGLDVLSSFSFQQTPQIHFGPGSCRKLVKTLPPTLKRVLLLTGKASFDHSSSASQIPQALEDSGISYWHERISGEPSPPTINDLVNSYHDYDVDLVIAAGGGSVLDGGKAVSAMLMEKEDVTVFLEGVGHRSPSGARVGLLAIPTTSGTGSETTANSVISKVGAKGFKKSLRHPSYIPDIALVDPELTLGCPAKLTAYCGMDCFSQLLEGYLSEKGSRLTDALALEGLVAVKKSLVAAWRNGDDLEARTNLSYAAMLSGIVLTNAGLGTVHGLASVIGGLYPLAHGRICGSLMAPVNAATLTRLQQESTNKEALAKYTRLGKVFSGQEGKSCDWYQNSFIDYLQKLASDFAVNEAKSLDLTEDAMKKIAELSSNKYNPVLFSKKELVTILQQIFNKKDAKED